MNEELFKLNICREEAEAIFNVALGGEARAADLEMAAMLCGFVDGLPCTLGEACDQAVEYVWDHFMGEPDEPTLEELQTSLRATIADVVERTRKQPEGLGGMLNWERFERYAQLRDLEDRDPPPGVGV
jgi:hypothetical protein